MIESKSCARLCQVVLLFASATVVKANLLSEALLIFPSDTKSVEYDNLAELRKLPSYQTLRQQYTEPELLQVLRSFRKLGITENSVEQIVLASNGTESFGVAFGTFSGRASSKTLGWNSLTNIRFHKEHILCPRGPACVWFFEDSTAVFGSQTQLRRLIGVRDGSAPGIRQNAALTGLLTRSQLIAPVVGAAPGSKILSWIGDSIPPSTMTALGLNKLLSGILWFSYDVSFPPSSQTSAAHVEMKLLCSPKSDAAALGQVLTAYASMQQAGVAMGLVQKQFDHLSIAASATTVVIKGNFYDSAR